MKSEIAVLRLALCSLLLAPYFSVQAQPKKVPRIGYLSAATPARESSRSEAIRVALRELGYVEGQNIATEYRYLEEKADRAPEIAAELVFLKVDVIVVAGGTEQVRAVKNATKTIPIIMTGGGLDPVEAGLIESLARPGGNVTGLTGLNRGLGGKRLELLKEVVPKITRVAVIYERAPLSRSVGSRCRFALDSVFDGAYLASVHPALLETTATECRPCRQSAR